MHAVITQIRTSIVRFGLRLHFLINTIFTNKMLQVANTEITIQITDFKKYLIFAICKLFEVFF